MGSHVLVPIDDSTRATQALEFVIESYPDAKITALHVVDPRDFYAATGIEGAAMANYERVRENREKHAEKLLQEASERAAEADVEIETDHVLGEVSRAILDYADENDVDHIVMGSHGRTGARRILLGSVAEKIARRSPVPVTIVR